LTSSSTWAGRRPMSWATAWQPRSSPNGKASSSLKPWRKRRSMPTKEWRRRGPEDDADEKLDSESGVAGACHLRLSRRHRAGRIGARLGRRRATKRDSEEDQDDEDRCRRLSRCFGAVLVPECGTPADWVLHR